MPILTKPRLLPIGFPTLELETEISFSLSRLRAYSFLANQIAPFQVLLVDWLPLFEQDLSLARAVKDAEAVIVAVDDDLDALALSLSSTLLAELGNNRKATRYVRYFPEAPSRMIRPILSGQLTIMRSWIPSLVDPSSSPAIQAIGQKLSVVVARADNAVAALSEAKQRQTDFYTLGAHKAFIDRVNALRQSMFGHLAELPHAQPDLNLQASFAQRFFLRASSDRKPATIPEVEERILRVKDKLKKLEDLLQALTREAEEEARLAEDAEVQEAMKTIEAAEKQRAEAEQRIAEARARLEKKKKTDE